jgi:hypothetical protein
MWNESEVAALRRRLSIFLKTIYLNSYSKLFAFSR